MPTPNALNIKVGAAIAKINGSEVGHTQNGSEVVITSKYKDVMVDRYGESVVQKVLNGMSMTAKLVVAEATIANILAAIPFGDDNTDNVGIGRKAGALATDEAVQLVLHPQENDDADLSLDVIMWKAISSQPVTLPFKNDNETAMEITFEAIVDETKTDGNLLGLIGDSTA